MKTNEQIIRELDADCMENYVQCVAIIDCDDDKLVPYINVDGPTAYRLLAKLIEHLAEIEGVKNPVTVAALLTMNVAVHATNTIADAVDIMKKACDDITKVADRVEAVTK